MGHMKAKIKEFLIWICLVCLCQFPIAALDDLPFELPAYPEGWREDDFEKRFKGSYGINSFLEPELDVDNFNVYEGVLAFLDNSEGAIIFIQNSMAVLDEKGIEASASLHFLLGNFFFENNQHDQASEQYVLAIHKHPNFLRAYENLGYSFMQNDQNEKALPVLLKALELGSNDSQIHGLIGFLYLDKKLYLSALSAFESAMLFNPRNNTWRFGIFQCLIHLNRNESALGVAEEILLFDPDNPSNWQNVASLLMRLNREDEVISHVEMVHQLGGASFRSRRLLGNLYYNREMIVQAGGEYSSMIDLASEVVQLEDVLEVCEGMLYFGFVEEAQSLFGKLTSKGTELGLVIDPESTEMIQAMIYMKEGRLDQAETVFRRVLKANPAQARALLFLAQILVLQRDFDQAGIYFELAQMYPKVSYNAYYAHAQLLLGLEQREEALVKLKLAQSIEASDELAEIISSLEETGRLIR
jgi:tetratricopeptide (TPR) repeat protein